MLAIGLLYVGMLGDWFRSRRRLQAEILVLRHQLNVLQRRAPRRPYLSWTDRALFIRFYRRFKMMGPPMQLNSPTRLC
jgi:hypothetical protein